MHGVTRKGMGGIPGCVVQEDQKPRKKQLEVRGKTKAAIMKINPKFPDLITTSVYNNKPLH